MKKSETRPQDTNRAPQDIRRENREERQEQRQEVRQEKREMKKDEQQPMRGAAQENKGFGRGSGSSFETRVRDSWPTLKNRFQKEYPNLTHDDLNYIEGQESQLFDRIQKRTGKSREQLETWMDDDTYGV